QSSSLGSGSRSSRPGQSSRDTRRRFDGEVAILEPLEGRVLLSGSPELLKDINTLTFGSDIRDIVGVGGTAFFLVHNDFYSGALWKSDGTAAGTAPVASFGPGEAFSSPQNLTAVGGTLFFTAFDDTHGMELWKSDGTAAGTGLVEDIRPGSDTSYPAHLTAVGGTLFFSADDGVHGRELWKSDGTAAGTVLVKDI